MIDSYCLIQMNSMRLGILHIHTNQPNVQWQTRTAAIQTQQYKIWPTACTHQQTSSKVINSYAPNTNSAVSDLTYCAYTPTNQQYSDKLVLPQYILSSMGLDILRIHAPNQQYSDKLILPQYKVSSMRLDILLICTNETSRIVTKFILTAPLQSSGV